VHFSLRNEGSSEYIRLCEGRESLSKIFKLFRAPGINSTESKSHEREKALPSVNHSILSAATAPDFISFPFFISSFSSPGFDFANFDLIQIIQIIHPFLD
jgi:hypothetical protein